jgi:hypothetical protein
MWIKTSNGTYHNCERFDAIRFIGSTAPDGFIENCTVVGVNTLPNGDPQLTPLSKSGLSASEATKLLGSIISAIVDGKRLY